MYIAISGKGLSVSTTERIVEGMASKIMEYEFGCDDCLVYLTNMRWILFSTHILYRQTLSFILTLLLFFKIK